MMQIPENEGIHKRLYAAWEPRKVREHEPPYEKREIGYGKEWG